MDLNFPLKCIHKTGQNCLCTFTNFFSTILAFKPFQKLCSTFTCNKMLKKCCGRFRARVEAASRLMEVFLRSNGPLGMSSSWYVRIGANKLVSLHQDQSGEPYDYICESVP